MAGNPLPLETGLASPARPRIPPTLSAEPLRDTGDRRAQGWLAFPVIWRLHF